MTVIEIDEKHAAALRAKAEAQGLTLEAWLKSLAGEVPSLSAPGSPRQAADRILELQKCVNPDPERWTVRDYINHDRR